LACIAAAEERKKKREQGAKISEAWKKLSEQDGCLRSPELDSVVQYIKADAAITDAWWKYEARRVHSNERFWKQSGRMRVLDRFFSQMRRDVAAEFGEDRAVVVAYGAANFSPSGRGRPTTPMTAVYKACFRHLSTYTQCECRTSRQHNRCLSDVHSCWPWLRVGLEVEQAPSPAAACCDGGTQSEQVDDEVPRERLKISYLKPPGKVAHGLSVPRNATELRGLHGRRP
jgi:hypothetical protein